MEIPLIVALVAYEGIQLLDVSGPASVFGLANDVLGRAHYRVVLASDGGGLVTTGCGIALATVDVDDVAADRIHTLIVPGAEEGPLRRLAGNARFARWVTDAAQRATRFGSVCTGAFVLAHYGLLRERRVATHWAACHRLAAMAPDARVDADAIYVEDGALWTSAGVTTGIDMCLAMVERDAGADVANTIAQRLVLQSRRAGFQSQFSPALRAQAGAGDAPRFASLIAWMADNLAGRLDVPRLAERVAMSERSFHRKFVALTGQTPAAFVEALRLERARQLLCLGITLKEVAARSGFSGTQQLCRAFERRFGMAPGVFRRMHRLPQA